MTGPNQMYAVDPEVINNFKDFVQILREFGFENARFIAILPRKWKQAVVRRIADIYIDSPKLQEDYVERARKKLGRFPDADVKIEQLRYVSTDAILGKSQNNNIFIASFNAKIVDKCISIDGECGTICFNDYQEGLLELELENYDTIRDVSKKISVDRQLKLFMPLIEYNDEITIIDPNMKFTDNVDDAYMMLIKEIIKAMSNQINSSSPNKTLCLYYKSDDYNGDLKIEREKKRWLDLFRSEINKGLVIRLFPLKEVEKAVQDLHDRWVLGHSAGGWGPPRGSKAQIKTEELNYSSMASGYVTAKLNDYKLENNRIQLFPGLNGPIVISKDSH